MNSINARVSLSIAPRTNYHKFTSLKQNNTHLLSLRFYGSDVQHGMTGSSAYSLTQLKSRCLRLTREESISTFIQAVDRIQFLAVVQLRLLALFIFKASNGPWIPFPASSLSDLPFCHIALTSRRKFSAFKDSRDYIGPTQIIHDNLPNYTP